MKHSACVPYFFSKSRLLMLVSSGCVCLRIHWGLYGSVFGKIKAIRATDDFDISFCSTSYCFVCVCAGAGALILHSHVALPARGWCGGVQVRGLASLKYRGMINVTITK